VKKLLIILLLIGTTLQGKYTKHKHIERWYQNKIAPKLYGSTEVKYKGIRADIITNAYACEVDFAYKAYEGIGQALYYGIIFNLKPCLILITENPRKDLKYILRAKRVSKKYNIKLMTVDKNINIKEIK